MMDGRTYGWIDWLIECRCCNIIISGLTIRYNGTNSTKPNIDITASHKTNAFFLTIFHQGCAFSVSFPFMLLSLQSCFNGSPENASPLILISGPMTARIHKVFCQPSSWRSVGRTNEKKMRPRVRDEAPMLVAMDTYLSKRSGIMVKTGE